jgi:hypothetical protein
MEQWAVIADPLAHTDDTYQGHSVQADLPTTCVSGYILAQDT